MESTASNSAGLISVDRAQVQELAMKLLQRKGMFAADAEIVLQRLVEADVCGRHDDGLGSLPQYLDAMDLGDIDPRARLITLTETPAISVVDGSTGMGHVAATRAMVTAIDKAKVVGIGSVAVKNSRPCGDLGGIALLAAQAGLIGIASTSFAVERPDATDSSDMLACAVPASGAASPWIARASEEELGDFGSWLCGLLTAGLVGANVQARKRKPLPAANTAEYSLTAIDPGKFATAELMGSVWQQQLKDRGQFVVESRAGEQTPATISLRPADRQTLAELAAKIKFPVTW
jgi:Malate/L-lactate dehydrogenase